MVLFRDWPSKINVKMAKQETTATQEKMEGSVHEDPPPLPLKHKPFNIYTYKLKVMKEGFEINQKQF